MIIWYAMMLYKLRYILSSW